MKEITLAEFIADCEAGFIRSPVFVGNNTNRIYGLTVKGQSENPEKLEVVWASVP